MRPHFPVLLLLLPLAASAVGTLRDATILPPAVWDVEANLPSVAPVAAASADGDVVVFLSDATNLVALDRNGGKDVFVRRRSTGETLLVSARPDGAAGNGASASPVVSADGRWVAFVSDASDLVSGDTNDWPDVFLRDLQSGSTERLSRTSTGGESPLGALPGIAMSPDARFVAFSSLADLVPGSVQSNLYLLDRSAGTLEIVSIGPNGQQPNGTPAEPRISPDGRWVSFLVQATNWPPAAPGPFELHLWVRDRLAPTSQLVATTIRTFSTTGPGNVGFDATSSRLFFQATTSSTPFARTTHCGIGERVLATGATAEVATPTLPLPGECGVFDVSSDGQRFAFISTAALVAGDANGARDAYVYDRSNGSATLASRTTSGAAAGAYTESGQSWCSLAHATGDVVFSSVSADVSANDRNDASDVFIAPLAGTSERISIAGTPQRSFGDDVAVLEGYSANGNVVLFVTEGHGWFPGATPDTWVVFDVASDHAVELVPPPGSADIEDVTLTANGGVAIASAQGGVVRYELPAGTRTWLVALPSGQSANVRATSATGDIVVLSSAASTLGVTDAQFHYVVVRPGGVPPQVLSLPVDGDVQLSNDGSQLFLTTAQPLVPADSNGSVDLYRYDLATAAVARLSTQSVAAFDVSPDGDWVAQVTWNGAFGVQVTNWRTGASRQVPLAGTDYAVATAREVAVSAGGRYVALTFLDAGSDVGSDVLRYDTANGRVDVLTARADGTLPELARRELGISDDGRHVAFNTFDAQLVPGHRGPGNGDVVIWSDDESLFADGFE